MNVFQKFFNFWIMENDHSRLSGRCRNPRGMSGLIKIPGDLGGPAPPGPVVNLPLKPDGAGAVPQCRQAEGQTGMATMFIT